MENKKNKIEYFGKGVDFTAMICLFLFTSIISSVVVSAVKIQYVKNLITSSFTALALISVSVFSTKRRKVPFFSSVKISGFNPIYLIPSFLLAFGMLFGLGFINIRFFEFLIKIGIEVSGAVLEFDGTFSLIISILSHAVMPAIYEEIFFRGIIVDQIKDDKTWLSVITVGLAFALYHCSLIQFFYQFIYGSLLCLLMLKSKNVLFPIIAHFANNCFIISDSYFGLGIDLTKWYFILFGIIALCLFFLFIFRNGKAKGESKPKTADYSVYGFWIPFGILGGLVCVVIMVFGVLPL